MYPLKPFEDCLEKITYTAKIQRKYFLGSGDFPIVSQETWDINWYWDNESDVFKIKKPVIIFWDHTKIIKYIDFDFVLGADGVKILQPKNFLDTQYFYYFLQSVELKSLWYARHYRLLRELDIPLPPISIQLNIVNRLDSAMAEIEILRREAESALASTRELWESTLESVFVSGRKDWEEKRFDEVCVLQRWYDLPTHARKEGEFPLVSSNGITDRINEYKVKAPWVVTWRSWTIWNIHFIEEDFWPLNTSLYIKDFHGNNERCVYYFLKQFDLIKYSSGAGVPTLNRNNVHCVMIAFPPLSEQSRIVAHLDAVRAETERLEQLYTEKLASLDELRRSVLAEAFV